MSDQFYAVQFRSMHNAIHSIAVFSLEEQAHDFFDFISNTEMLPDEHEMELKDEWFVGMEEIDYRNPPYEYKEMEILYINEWDKNHGYIPDVYNY